MSAHNWRQLVRYWGLRHIRRLFGDHIAELVRKERKQRRGRRHALAR